ncbi:hypothetical protein Patl1_27142 [Pistacia atlantica]|uniref:Uncharacterized protein n=1 Tax=Pistacia atlantica TaxID=434234 RepID=A0ACC1AYY2_9ROSI|nr:hypothetical protein Patl1_27142 [Pistacia atlantica]
MAEGGTTLEYTPTWVVALVCSVIVVISLAVERVEEEQPETTLRSLAKNQRRIDVVGVHITVTDRVSKYDRPKSAYLRN